MEKTYSEVKTGQRYIQSNDKLNLFCRYWIPGGQLEGCILLVHGLGEHGGRYAQWAEGFAGKQFATFVMDLRGHGHSDGPRGYTGKYDFLIQDIENFHAFVSKMFPGVPVFLYGHSMGGNLAVNYVLRKNPRLAGLILSSPWLKLARPPSKLLVYPALLLSLLWPRLRGNNKVNPEHLSRNKTAVKAYAEDPLVHDKISPRLYQSIQKNGTWAMRNKHKVNIPVLVLHGGRDKITSAKASKEMAENARNIAIKIWPGRFHELHHDKNKEDVFEIVSMWLMKHALETNQPAVKHG
jgi:alpha-beta hydrolase superfamily lysophospholipase